MSSLRVALLCPALVLTLAIVSAACAGRHPAVSPPDPAPPLPSDQRPLTISLERTQCYGHCPWYTITIGSDGTVEYEGRKDVKVVGKRKTTITAEARSRLLQELDKTDFFNLNFDRCTTSVADASAVVLLACDGVHIARLATADVEFKMDTDPEVHASLRELANLVDEVTDSRQWVD